MDYDYDEHSKYLLMFHMIFVCKYRKLLLYCLWRNNPIFQF